ncbi:Uncharacterised protein [Vibrio cholerae]|nr:Uncharacterised protein [Vibrio cholerae]
MPLQAISIQHQFDPWLFEITSQQHIANHFAFRIGQGFTQIRYIQLHRHPPLLTQLTFSGEGVRPMH